MHRRLSIPVAALAAALTCLTPAAAAKDKDGLRAGAAGADITPPIGTPMFAYTARSGATQPHNLAMQLISDPDSGMYAKTFMASTGIHTRVKARAIVLQTATGKFALVQADLGGVPYAMVRDVAERVAKTGITADRILVSATHTHSSTGPIWPADSGGYAALGGDFFDARVYELTTAGIAKAILRANKRLEPARAGVGHAEAPDASRNRNFDPFRRNEDVPTDETAARAVSVNRKLTVLRVDARDGRPLGVWSNFAIHPTSFGDDNGLFSGDNAAFAERIAEDAWRAAARRASGRKKADPVNVWTNSSEGDISPNGGPDRLGGQDAQYVKNSFGGAHMAGSRVGAAIIAAWRDAGERLSGTLDLDARRTFVDFDGTTADGEPVGPIPVLGPGGITFPDGTCAPVENMAGPGQGMKFPGLAGRGLVPNVLPVSLWRVGGLGVVALPSEVTKQMGQRISQHLVEQSGGAFEHVVVAGLTNAYVSYTATPEEYDACHYEGSFTLFGRQTGARWRDTASALLAPLLTGAPAPQLAPEPDPLVPDANPWPGPHETPTAGEAQSQPESVERFGRTSFSWQGGDPTYDAPRDKAFVTLQRKSGGRWTRVATDDSWFDVTQKDTDDVWTETFQFGECSPTGTHRFVVRGRADRGSGPEPYRVASDTFEVAPSDDLTAEAPTVSGTDASVRVLYPDPGAEALYALPRLVRSGEVLLEVTDPSGAVEKTKAEPGDDGAFRATVPAGSTVRVLEVRDGCGNTGR